MLLVFKYSAVPLVASRLKSNSFNFCAISIMNFLLSLSIEINTVPYEGKGIRRNILAKSDFKISIPQINVDGIDSYNAANSLAIAAYHFKISTF